VWHRLDLEQGHPKEKLEVGAEWGDIRDEAADMALAVTGGQSFQYVN
jgi:hypothetical protein